MCQSVINYISAMRWYPTCSSNFVTNTCFGQTNKVYLFTDFLDTHAKNNVSRYHIIAPICLNLCKFMQMYALLHIVACPRDGL